MLFLSKSIDWLLIQNSWKKGIVDIRPFSSARAGYVAKYSVKQKDLDYENRLPTFHMQSNGLGACFLEGKSLETLNNNLYWRNLSGRSVKLPRYYLEKLGYTRSRFRWKDDDGNVYTKSFSHKIQGMYMLGLKVRSDFLKRDAIEREKIGSSVRSYDVYLAEKQISLEQTLERRFWNDSSYAKYSRIGL